MVDKNQAVIDYMIQCPQIRDSPLYFNFINAQNDHKQFITTANDRNIDKPYIDGSVLKRYTFTIIDYKSIANNALVKLSGYSDENVEDMLQVQDIIDWITEQDKLRNFPDFGEHCSVDSIKALTDNPNLNGVDNTVSPALAKYSVSIQIDYIDKTNIMWR